MYSDSCAFDCASVIFKESDGYVTVLTGRGPRCECFCRVVKDLEHFLAVMRARYPCLQVRSDNEEALKHVLKEACEQVHLEHSNTRLETPASNGRGENSVRAMKEMIQRQKDVVFSLGIEFSIKHPLFALLVRHSEWILNHLVRNDFLVELDNRVIKISPYESHTGNPAPRSTSLLNRILVGRRDGDDEQPRFQQAWFLGLIAGSGEVIALHPDGVQRHHGEWRVSPLDDPESNLSTRPGPSVGVAPRVLVTFDCAATSVTTHVASVKTGMRFECCSSIVVKLTQKVPDAKTGIGNQNDVRVPSVSR